MDEERRTTGATWVAGSTERRSERLAQLATLVLDAAGDGISISAGHAAFDPAEPVSVEELTRAADASMYQQKRTSKRR